MSEPIKMSIFDSVDNTGSMNMLPEITSEATSQEMLDYMVLVLARQMTCSIAFKGGYMLNQLLGGASRMTRVVDFSISEKENYEDVKSILEKIAQKFVAVNLISRYVIKETIEPTKSGGVDFYNETGAKILGVDVGLHNISYGVRHYNLSFAAVDGFTVERMLSDKLIAITTRKRFRRTKDLYDFYVITNFFDVDLKKLAEFIKIRGGAEWQNIPFNPTVMEQYNHAWDKLDLQAFGGTGQLQKPTFSEAINRFYDFALRLKNYESSYKWRHADGRILHV